MIIYLSTGLTNDPPNLEALANEDISTVAIGLGDQIDSLEFQQQLKKIAVRDDHYFFIEDTDILLKRC